MPVDIPMLGARNALWFAAQLHLFFAAFVLGAPIFIVISEWLGLRTQDPRYERLAKETMKVVAIAYSLTAIFGVLFAFVLMGPYQPVTNYLFRTLYPVFALYGLFILLETVCMYIYWYTWEPWSQTVARKRAHIGIGVLLNLLGTIVMFLMNAVSGFMNTPPKEIETASLWMMVNNAAWWPLNLHRFLGNVTFGGFVVALFAAFMFLTSREEEDRAFYDWMGYIGNLIGVGTLMTLPLAGYILAKDFFLYDAQLATFMMADKLSGYFVTQGLLVVLLFLGANYYMWLSMKRIEGGIRFEPHMKAIFAVMLAGGIIWMVPQNFFPDLLAQPPAGVSEEVLILPERFAFLGLMVAKALAVTAIIIMTFVTYLLYRRARATGKILWGRIDPMAQYVLIFIPAIAVYLMGLMGAIRELTRMDYHIYGLVKDITPYWYTATLGHSSIMAAVTTVLFFVLLAFIFWIGFVLRGSEEG
ncbi:MAG: cytochrome ubiquinol oxidase subunit I [Candidatus Bipolaricaulia bacterium]